MADLEEGEITDSDQDSRLVQEPRRRSKSTSRLKEGHLNASLVERTRSSSSHKKSKSSHPHSVLRADQSHSCIERSFCRDTYLGQHCLVRKKSIIRKDKIDFNRSLWGNKEVKEMRMEKTTGDKCYSNKSKSTFDSYDNRNIMNNRKKSRPRKESGGRDNLNMPKNNGTVFREISKTDRLKKTLSRKQTVALTQNNDNPLMHKLVNAGLAKKPPTNSSDLQVEVGPNVSVSSPELDIWTDFSTLSDDAADKNKTKVPTPNESDSDIEIIIPPKKNPTVVTLDSDGEEVNATGGDCFDEASALLLKNQLISSNELNQTPDTNMDSANLNSDNSDLSNISAFTNKSVTNSIYLDDESPMYSPSSPSTICSVELIVDSVDSNQLEKNEASNTTVQISTTNKSVIGAGLNINQHVNLVKICKTNQSEGDVIDHPANIIEQTLTSSGSGVEQLGNKPKQTIPNLNLDEHCIQPINSQQTNDHYSKQQKLSDKTLSPKSTVSNCLKNRKSSDLNSEPYSPHSSYEICSIQSQNSCLINSNTSKFTNNGHYTTPSPSSSFSSYVEKAHKKKARNSSISNSNCNNNADSFIPSVDLNKSDVPYNKLELLDEQEPYSPCSDYETANPNLNPFQSNDIEESSGKVVAINDHVNKIASYNCDDPLVVDNIDNSIKNCPKRDVGKLSDDDDDDISKLRLIALSSKRKNNQDSPSVQCDKGITCQSSTTSEDLLVNEEEDVLKLRVAALKSAVIKKHEERKKMGVVIKKISRSDSSLIDDLITREPVTNELEFKDNLTHMPPSPSKSTKSVQGEEDMEISDSNSDNMNQDNHTSSTVTGNYNPKSNCNTSVPLIQTTSQELLINKGRIVEGKSLAPSNNMITPSQPLPPGVDVSVRDSVFPIVSPFKSMLPCLFSPPPPPPFPPIDDPHQPLTTDSSSECNQYFYKDTSISQSHEYVDPRVNTDYKESPHKSTPRKCFSHSEVNTVNLADKCPTPHFSDIDQGMHANKSLQLHMYIDESNSKQKKSLGKQNRAMTRTLQVIPLTKNIPKKLSTKKNRKKSEWLKKKNKSLLCKKPLENESNVLCVTNISSSSKLHDNVKQTLMPSCTPLCTTSAPENRIPISSFHSTNEEIYCKDYPIQSNPFKNKLSNIESEMDLSEMIILDEVGMSPEHRAEDELTVRAQTNTMTTLSDSPPKHCISSKRTQMNPIKKSCAGSTVSNINSSNHLIILGEATPNHYNKTAKQGSCNSEVATGHFSNAGKSTFSEDFPSNIQKDLDNISTPWKVGVKDAHKYKPLRLLNAPRRCVVQGRHSLKVVVPTDSAPVVNRLVINVGKDSDSEDESEWLHQVRVQDPAPVPPGPVVDEELERNIDLLLMKARQNSDKHSSVQSQKEAGNATEHDDLADTPLKLLPKETQEEYKRLKKIIEEKDKQQKLRKASLSKYKDPKQLGARNTTSNPAVNNKQIDENETLLPKETQEEYKRLKKIIEEKEEQQKLKTASKNKELKELGSSDILIPGVINQSAINEPMLEDRANHKEVLESTKEKIQLQGYKKTEELASRQAELIGERFTLIDAATQVKEEIHELERQIAHKLATETELRRLREVMARVESELEQVQSSVSEQRTKVVDMLTTLDARQEHVTQLEHDCCLLGTQLCSPGYELPTTGKELLVKKLHQVRDKSSKLLHKSLTNEKSKEKLDSSSEQIQTQQHVGRLNKTDIVEEPQPKADKHLLTKLQQLGDSAVNKNLCNPKSTSASCSVSQDIKLSGISLPNSLASCTFAASPDPSVIDKPSVCNSFPNSPNTSKDNIECKTLITSPSKEKNIEIDDQNLSNRSNSVCCKRALPQDFETSMDCVKKPNILQVPRTLPSTSLQPANTKSCMKYKSLLQYKESSKSLNDSRSSIDVLCPYDLSGKCQDSHCPYQHLQIRL